MDHDPAQDALAEAAARLRALYGERLVRAVLYGSRARGDAHPDSDADVLVVLREPYDAYAELKHRLSPLAVDLLDEFGVLVSFQPFGLSEAEDLGRPLMWNVAREGVAL